MVIYERICVTKDDKKRFDNIKNSYKKLHKLDDNMKIFDSYMIKKLMDFWEEN